MGVARIYQAGTPYNGSQLAELDYEQTTDTMYLAHLDHEPAKITRSAHTSWTHASITFGPTISAPTGVSAAATTPNTDAANSGDSYFPQEDTYVVTAINDETGQESRASSESSVTNDLALKRNYNTITWSAVADATRYNVYKAHNNQFFGYIGTTEDLTFQDDNIGPALDQAPPQGENPFATADDYPSSVALFDQRLLWGRTRNVPNGLWGSRIGVNQLENMDRSRPARPDDAFSLAVVASKANPINALASSTSLLALTTNGIFSISGDGSGGPIEASSAPAARRQIGRGSSRLRPIGADNVFFYQPATGFAVRSIGYSFEFDGIKSNDVSIYSPHFFSGFEIVDWAYAQEPMSVVWAVRSDGKLLAFTWEQEQQVWGWTLCETQGLVKRVAVITEGGQDRLYLIVERVIGGVTRRFVERMASHLWTDVADTCFMDCAVSGTFDPPQNTFTGLTHLEGEEVSVQADGRFYEGLTVTGGAISLPNEATASKVSIGLPYQVDVKTLPVRVTSQYDGPNIGKRQQVGDVILQMRRSSMIEAGIDEDNLYIVKQETATGTRDLIDGLTNPLSMANKAGQEAEVLLRQTAPAPFELLAIIVEPMVNED